MYKTKISTHNIQSTVHETSKVKSQYEENEVNVNE